MASSFNRELVDNAPEFVPDLSKYGDTAKEWPSPENIKPPTYPVLRLESSMLPQSIRGYVVDTARRLNRPLENVAVPVIAVIGSLIGCGCVIRPKRLDDWSVPANIWALIVSNTGTLKTPSLQAGVSLLNKLKLGAKADFAKLQAEFKAQEAVWKARVEDANTKIKTATKPGKNADIAAAQAEYANLEEPEQPTLRRYDSNDATAEKLAALESTNPRGILVWRDELAGLLKKMEERSHESDRAFYLEGFNGLHPYTQDRIQRGTIHIPHHCLGILGTIQPDMLRDCLIRDLEENNDGFVQRFQLAIWPDPIPYALIDEKPDKMAVKQITDMVEKLAEMDFAKHGASSEEGNDLPFYRFADTGPQDTFLEWLKNLEGERLIDPKESSDMIDHLAKYRSLCPKLALIFHVIEVAAGHASGPVSGMALNMAMYWCKFLESHARRIYQQSPSKLSLAVYSLAQRISNGELEDGLTSRDINRKGWKDLKDSEVLEAATSELVRLHWLEAVETPPAKGQKRTFRFNVNPLTKNFLTAT